MANDDGYIEIKDLAKGIVALCIRNNTVLEDYHAEQVPIDDERMKQFMKNCVDNVYFVLTRLSDGDTCGSMIKWLQMVSEKHTRKWDDPDIPEWVEDLQKELEEWHEEEIAE